MRRSLASMALLALALSLVSVPYLYPQATKDAKTGLDRFDGIAVSIDKNTSTITLRETGRTVTWQIVYNKDTAITYLNQKAPIDEVKEGRRIIVLGTMDKASNKMNAVRIEVRTK